MALPTAQKAIVIQGPGEARLVTDRPIPSLRDDYILVKTAAVGLNPTDWKHVDYLVKEAGPVIGCDYAGVIEAIGPAVIKPLRKGDRVCGMAHGSNVVQKEDGTFAEYIVAKGDLQIKIPDNITFEEAATLGIGITTVGQSLYQALGLALPSEPVKNALPILIYGGSTATGMLGIQYAKLSGYDVITTCSPRNNDLVMALGAAVTFDYNDPECAAKIRAYTNDKLTMAWDTIALPASAKICEDALSSSPPSASALRYHSLLPLKVSRSEIKATNSLAYTATGEAFTFGGRPVPALEEDYKFAVKFWDLSRELLESGKLKILPVQVEQGLDRIPEGLQALRGNTVSGKKLVYKI
ncbi:hypothetical protein N5P37_011783 [Trichoderma harzianum]|nr:hypothetical protein N5P37_011783 [Trichoderma harzianum]